MPIDDVDTAFSPGWWLKRLANQQAQRRPHLDRMWKRYDSDPPLPEGARAGRAAYESFQKLARTNYEELIARTVLDRQTPTGFRTAAANDDNGDAAARAMWAANLGPILASDVLEFKLAMSEGYVIVGLPDDDSDGQPVMTAEDPRQVIASVDPVRPTRTRAALKTYWDPDLERDIAYVYLAAGATIPGSGQTTTRAVVRRAVKDGRQRVSTLGPNFRLSPRAWSWEPDPTWDGDVLELPMSRCPVVRVQNRGGKAEFERHVDLIDRIRHTILQRMVIVTMQAFRQRAAKGLPDRYPDDYPVVELRGQEIDYSGLFIADPAAVWLLPGAAELWESGAIDLTPVLASVKDDIRELATVSRTPFYTFMPDGANQTAEGASLQREQHVFKVEDHNTRDGVAFAQVMSLGFEMVRDSERAKLGQLETMWAPVERYGLAERYAAAVQAKAAGVSQRLILTDVLQMTPEQAQRELAAATQDAFRAAISGAAAPDPTQVALQVASTRAAASQGAENARTAAQAAAASRPPASSTATPPRAALPAGQ